MKKSAGILVYRQRDDIEFFLVHPGGPFFRKKDLGVWTIPKGEINDGEDPLIAAQREFFEETGLQVPGPFIELKPVKMKSGKLIFAWTTLHNIDETKVFSNLFEIEWPPKSGKLQMFPEVDKAGWFTEAEARQKIIEVQVPLIDELLTLII